MTPNTPNNLPPGVQVSIDQPRHAGAESAHRSFPFLPDAALGEFAERGVRGATIRSIAARAGVSPALVQHHFGTKDELRAACDDFVLAYLRNEVADGLWDPRLGDPHYLERIYQSAPVVLRYLTRSFVEGSRAATTVFDDLAARSGTWRNNLASGPAGRSRSCGSGRSC